MVGRKEKACAEVRPERMAVPSGYAWGYWGLKKIKSLRGHSQNRAAQNKPRSAKPVLPLLKLIKIKIIDSLDAAF